MNGKEARMLRSWARALADVPNKTVNQNIEVKPFTTDKLVMNDKGVYVQEVVPVTTYTTVYVDRCPRKEYKQLKKEHYNG